MVFGFLRSVKHREIDAAALNMMIKANQALVVDVRESDEFAAGHIPGAINMPLSTFQADKLPVAKGKTVILNCARLMPCREICGQHASGGRVWRMEIGRPADRTLKSRQLAAGET